ncbi:conserved hypothetical protein [Burkholderia cenocepacia HI2424]|uniref:Prevent-host-death protein n=4 Tax=Burkholderia cepacia complex TaxID=87882 RepID=B1K942_BURO0|nr:conserved hypothetical protein [Burkholderia cenocepacia HI2424]ACA94599.1 hypothetical protein Bcenmc03_5472 [Burkholderia orbicola MC0-3]BEV49864.1 hypothetical protein BconGalA64_23630 [Burkholderia contaminans]
MRSLSRSRAGARAASKDGSKTISSNDPTHIAMPLTPVSKSEFKARALEHLRLIEASGEDLIVTDHGKPTLEIRPYRSREAQPLDILRGSVMRYDNPLDPIAKEDWETSL